MPADFTEYRISQEQIDRLNDALARMMILEKSLVTMDAKLEKYMTGLDNKLEKLTNAVAEQNARVNNDLAELRVDVLALKSENRFWRWGIVIAVGVSLFTLFLMLWRT